MLRLCQKRCEWVLVPSVSFFWWVVALAVPGGLSVLEAPGLKCRWPVVSQELLPPPFWGRVSVLCLHFCTSLGNVEMRCGRKL